MTVEAGSVVAWAAAFVALWWVIDWLNMRQQGEPLPLRRAPLRVLADVSRKLVRNRTLLAVLAALWIIDAAMLAVQLTFQRVTALGTPAPAQPFIGRMLDLPSAVPQLLARELPEAYPRLLQAPLGNWGTMLFGLLLAAGLIRVAMARPKALGDKTSRRLYWPAGLLIASAAASIAILFAGREFFERFGYVGSAAPPLTVLWMVATMAILPALIAPAHALLWRLVLEVTRGGTWSFTTTLRAVAESWLPVALLLLIAGLARVAGVLGAQVTPVAGYLYAVVLILLTLAPYAIVDSGSGLGAALARSWRLFRQRPVDAIAFGLRFALLFAVLGGLVALLEPQSATAWYVPLLGIVRQALVLLQVAVLAGLFVHLSELLEQDDACASCPELAEDDE